MVLLGIQMEKTLAVTVPAVPADPALLSYFDAMAEAIGGERGDELRDMAAALRADGDLRLLRCAVPPAAAPTWRKCKNVRDCNRTVFRVLSGS